MPLAASSEVRDASHLPQDVRDLGEAIPSSEPGPITTFAVDGGWSRIRQETVAQVLKCRRQVSWLLPPFLQSAEEDSLAHRRDHFSNFGGRMFVPLAHAPMPVR